MRDSAATLDRLPAPWRSGYAAACKAVYTGSIPVGASVCNILSRVHRDFRELLDDAKGESEFVFALNLDIRGFSDWSDDPAQSVLYLKKLYTRLYDRYFSDASLVKPTGDGLMVVSVFEEEELEQASREIVNNAIEIVETFGSITLPDRMVNFPVPEEVGIGIARGSAARLASGDKTLDYSGRVLNLASRLMDIARPYGLVIDEDFEFDLLSDEVQEKFTTESVYLKGVSPHSLIGVRYWPDDIEIPDVNRHPLDEPLTKHASAEMTLAELRNAAKQFLLELPSRPPNPDALAGRMSHAKVLPGRRKSTEKRIYHSFPVQYQEMEGIPEAVVDTDHLASVLDSEGVRRNWPIRIKVSYRVN